MKKLHDRGELSIEFALLIPLIMVLIATIFAAGRIQTARGHISQAAQDGVRAASITSSASEAIRTGEQAARDGLGAQSIQCSRSSVDVDVRAFANPVGTPGSISLTITCEVPLSDLGIPFLSSTFPLEASETTVLDTYRSRTR